MAKAIKKNNIPAKKNLSAFYIIIAFILPVLLYLQTVNFGFSYFDDDGIIINNIKFLSNFSNASHAFLTDAFIIKMSHFYRPLQSLSYMTDIQLSGGNNPWMYHLSNILLLGAIACMLYILLRKYSIPPKMALLGTLIYCMHPLFTSCVALIPTRGDLLLMLFSLLSFYFLAVHIQSKKKFFILLHWISFTLALFSKETAVLLPLLFAFYIFIASHGKGFGKKFIILIILYLISGIAWYWLRSRALGDYSNPNDITGFAAVILNIRSIPESLAKFFLPSDITPIPGFSIFNTLLGIIIILFLLFLFIKNKERAAKEKLFCLSWFLLFMMPPMLYKHPYIDFMDHRFFLPLIGILLFLLFIFPKRWLVKGDIKNAWLYIAVIIFLGSFTLIKSRPYADAMSFYNAAVSHNPNSAFAYYNRGCVKSDKKDLEGANEDYSNAISIRPAFVEAYFSRAMNKGNMDDTLGAMTDYNTAIRLCPTYFQAYYGRGNVWKAEGNFQKAIEDYSKAISISPDYYDAYNNRGLTKEGLRDHSSAMNDFNKAIEIDPSNKMAIYNRGCLKNITEDYAGAIEDFNRTIEIDPSNGDAYNNKGVSFYSLGKYKEAISSYNKAIEINPEYTDAYFNRALAEYKSKNIQAVAADCDQVLKINPKDQRALILKNKVFQEEKK